MEKTKWIDGLSEDDLAFLKRFIVSSGSLKELARIYNISYPTVRLRLDRLIQKVTLLDSTQVSSEFERLVQMLYVEGKVDAGTTNALLAAYRNEQEKKS